MRPLRELDAYRLSGPEIHAIFGSAGDDHAGAFRVVSKVDQACMFVLATTGGGWDHVSVSRADRCPTWAEMGQVHRLFFRPDEEAMQLHAPVGEHEAAHPLCLNLWRPNTGNAIPRPPADLAAVKPRAAASAAVAGRCCE